MLILDLLSEFLKREVTPTLSFNELDVDNIDIVEILMLIEAEYNIDIPALVTFETVQDLILYLEKNT